MKFLFLSFSITALSFCAFSQSDSSKAGQPVNKIPGNVLATHPEKRVPTPDYAPGEKYPDPGLVTNEAVERYYYEEFQIKDFLKKYPDYPRFINRSDFQNDMVDYKDRVGKWMSEHKEFQEMMNKRGSSGQMKD